MRWRGSDRRCLLGHFHVVSASVSSISGVIALPLYVFGPRCLCLLALGLGDTALDTEGGAIGARYT